MTSFELHQWLSVQIRTRVGLNNLSAVQGFLREIENWDLEDLTPEALVALTTPDWPRTNLGGSLFWRGAAIDLHHRLHGVPLPRDGRDRILGYNQLITDDVYTDTGTGTTNVFLALSDREIALLDQVDPACGDLSSAVAAYMETWRKR